MQIANACSVIFNFIWIQTSESEVGERSKFASTNSMTSQVQILINAHIENPRIFFPFPEIEVIYFLLKKFFFDEFNDYVNFQRRSYM